MTTITSTRRSTTQSVTIVENAMRSICLRAKTTQGQETNINAPAHKMKTGTTADYGKIKAAMTTKSIIENEQTNEEILSTDYSNNNVSGEDDDCSCVTPNLSDEESSYSCTPTIQNNKIKSTTIATIKPNKSSIQSHTKHKAMHRNTSHKDTRNWSSERRVRGLWNPQCICLFSKIHNDLLIHAIFGYLTTSDKLLGATDVCTRWRYCVNESHCWKEVHITEDLLGHASLLDVMTSKALCIERLVVEDVQHTLSAEFAVLGIGSCVTLRSLCVKGYAALLDSHVNLMLLMRKNYLKCIRMEYCPGLTDCSLGYIVNRVPNLLFLSVRGCLAITDHGLSHLCKYCPNSFFTPMEYILTASFLPYIKASRLEEISSVFFMLPSSSQKNLHSLDFSHTQVTASGICNALLSPSKSNTTLSPTYRILKLLMAGSGESWTADLFLKLQSKLFWNVLQEFDISTANPFAGNVHLSDDAFHHLPKSAALVHINLSGHVNITGFSIASILNASPNLHTLYLGGCASILHNLDYLCDALMHSSSLRTLILWRCFGNIQRCTQNPNIYPLVYYFIQSLCQSPCRHSLTYLDLEGCYAIDKDMVDLLRMSCTNTITFKLRGTKYYAEEKEKLL